MLLSNPVCSTRQAGHIRAALFMQEQEEAANGRFVFDEASPSSPLVPFALDPQAPPAHAPAANGSAGAAWPASVCTSCQSVQQHATPDSSLLGVFGQGVL
jgi:hypothetical protein